jgi:hypothetical protein
LRAQILIPPESTLHLQLVVMDKHLLDDELSRQILISPEPKLPLYLVAMDRHLLDDELTPQFMMLQTLDQGNSHSPTITKVKCSCGLKLSDRTILLQ